MEYLCLLVYMDIGHISSNIAKRDKLLLQVNDEIKRKEAYLAEKTADIDKNVKLNSFLREVQKDYHKYSDAIIEEKQKQKKAMEILAQYIAEVADATNDINKLNESTKRDQDNILDEIVSIKEQLDPLVQK